MSAWFLDNELSTKTIMLSYPELFEKILAVNSREIKDIIKVASPSGIHPIKLQLLHSLDVFIDESSEEGMYILYHHVK